MASAGRAARRAKSPAARLFSTSTAGLVEWRANATLTATIPIQMMNSARVPRVSPHRDRGQRDPERHRDDRQGQLAAAAVFDLMGHHGHLALRAGKTAPGIPRLHEPGIDAGVNLLADLVEKRINDGRLVVRTEFTVRLGGGADFVGG